MALAADVRQQPRPPRRAALIGQHREVDVGARIDPFAQRDAAGPVERRALALAVLERQHPPAARFEDVVEAAKHAIGGGVV